MEKSIGNPDDSTHLIEWFAFDLHPSEEKKVVKVVCRQEGDMKQEKDQKSLPRNKDNQAAKSCM